MSGELVVPTPQIPPELVDSGTGLLLDRAAPITFTLGAVRGRDGSEIDISKVDSSGFYIYRQDASGLETIWNKSTKEWATPADVLETDRELNPLEYKGDDNTWKGLLIFMGEDGKFLETDPGGVHYRYFVRCCFENKVSEGIVHSGESDKSISIILQKLGGDAKSGIDFDPDPKSPNTAKFYIKNGSDVSAFVELHKDGSITIRNNNSSSAITIESGGRVVIDAEVVITRTLRALGGILPP